ncbi:hypothetical protein HAX54_020305 [Datura stramonium]|uniref:Uncharacterized protein n=1 Tax=Datura stramonium TaxID=4076 RepID=A0ABS8UT81_DATST|nr:hypothetical protein [Datura stramonium]
MGKMMRQIEAWVGSGRSGRCGGISPVSSDGGRKNDDVFGRRWRATGSALQTEEKSEKMESRRLGVDESVRRMKRKAMATHFAGSRTAASWFRQASG